MATRTYLIHTTPPTLLLAGSSSSVGPLSKLGDALRMANDSTKLTLGSATKGECRLHDAWLSSIMRCLTRPLNIVEMIREHGQAKGPT